MATEFHQHFIPLNNQPARGLSTGSASTLPRLFPWPAVYIAVAALAVLVPWIYFGIPSGHDFEFHMFSWLEVASQWKQGILYPRWAEWAHWGYGEARFLFYPPASWMLGAALGSLLPWKLASGAFTWVALSASGSTMFLLTRRYFSRTDAIFAAVFYAVNPYYLVVVYWRSACAELLAGALLPLLLLFVLGLEDEGKRAIVPLALTVAAAWLTNAPSAVMVNYSLALLVVIVALHRRSWRVLGYGAAAVMLGAALAAFYLFPAAYEEKWVNIAEVLSPGVRPQDNFLFTIIGDADHNRFNFLVSGVAVGEVIALAAAVYLSGRWRGERTLLWWTLTVWAAAAVVLMLPFTLVFWEHLPKMRFVQLPWRWLLCMNAAFTLLLAAGVKRWFSRIALYAGLLLVVLGVGRGFQPPWWDSAADIKEMQDALLSGSGYEGTDEYVPLGVDPYELNKDAPRAMVEGSKARVQAREWRAQSKLLQVQSERSGKLVLRLFNYPSWRVEVNGHRVMASSRAVTGQTVVPIASGESLVRVTLARTWDRKLGGWVSVLAGLLTALWWRWERKLA
jgi:hypothetical protein